MQLFEGAHLDGLQQMVDRLADKLGRSVAIDDARGRLVVSSRHFGEEDSLRVYAIVQRVSDPRVMAHFHAHDIYRWTRPGRLPPSPEIEFKGRVVFPIRDHDILFGHLFLIDEDVREEEVEETAQTVERIGQLMHRRLVVHQEAHRRSEQLAVGLVSDRAERRAEAVAGLLDEHLLAAVEPALAVAFRVVESPLDPHDLETALRAAVEVHAGDRLRAGSLWWARGPEAVVLLFEKNAAAPTARSLAAALVERIGGSGGITRVVAGFGDRDTGPDAAARSWRAAQVCLRAATMLPRLGDVLGPGDLGVYNLLLRLPPQELSPARYPASFRALLADDGATALLETLETYLDCAGDATAASARLHVHRSTLYYRLGRIETISGADLRDGSHRLDLHLALRLKHLLDADPHRADPEVRLRSAAPRRPG